MNASQRLSTGVSGLDERLGGGLVPGTMTVIVGATGIGKTQLGLHFANAGVAQEGRRGVIFDMASRGDAQSHGDYARRMFGWELEPVDAQRRPDLEDFFSPDRRYGDYLRVFDYGGRRVTRRDLDFDELQAWQAELARKLNVAIAFFYGNFVQGVRRAVIDGIEPVVRAADSIQFDLLEYIDHQILRKDADWVARDLFRERFRQNAAQAAAAAYDPGQLGFLTLVTSSEMMLDELITRPLEEGDLSANANTLIYMGKVRSGSTMGRALYVAKHRGSACTDDLVPYTIDESGLRLG